MKMMTYLTVVSVTVTVLSTDLFLHRHSMRCWSRPSQSTPNPLRWVFSTIEEPAPVLQVFGSVSYTIRTSRVKTGFPSLVGFEFAFMLVFTYLFMTVINFTVGHCIQGITKLIHLFRRNPDEDRPPHPVANVTLDTPSRRGPVMDSSSVTLTRSSFRRALPEVLQHCITIQ